MKTQISGNSRFIALAVIILMSFSTFAQNKKSTLTVLNIDAQGVPLTSQQLGNLLRIEVERLDTFEVMDRYDVTYMVDKHKLNITNCFGKIGLVEVGKTINSDKMLSGSVEMYGEIIIVTIRLIDVKTEKIEKVNVREFLNLPKELQSMIRISLHELFGRKNDETLVSQLTKKNSLDNPINNPNKTKLNLSGPRMGFTVSTGESAKIMSAPKVQGGFNVVPVMFQFGYQFEAQYLNQGDFQALFEFIPLVTGLDQSLFIPSFTIMNGLRNNVNGWEIGFGPTIFVNTFANGYYDAQNNWHIESELMEGSTQALTKRMDSRGSLKFGTGFIFGFGKTFRSGKLNIPVNGYVIPSKDGFRFGLSFGYNAKKG